MIGWAALDAVVKCETMHRTIVWNEHHISDYSPVSNNVILAIYDRLKIP